MNCSSIQEWLPLYVSRDLEEGRRRSVAAHLDHCAECAAVATEYETTRQMLGEFVAPAFDDSVYSDIRQHVLREIESKAHENSHRPLAQMFLDLFRPRLTWAVAAALVLAIGLGAYYFVANRESSGRNPAGPLVRLPAPPPTANPDKTPDTVNVKNQPTPQRPVTKRPAQSANRAVLLARNNRRQPAIFSEAAVESNKLAAPSTVQSSEKVFRLEMQTKDPNIRIIWLTPQPTRHDVPGKTSRGV
jgi:hypothetical protein